MTDPIVVGDRTYVHFSRMTPFTGKVEDRGFLSPKKKRIRLKDTRGAYVPVDGHNILFVIDGETVSPGSDDWNFIQQVAQKLAESYDRLNPRAKEALKQLVAVVFAKSPKRSFASVKKSCFFYDIDEFLRSDGSRVRAQWVASNIVHDANHVRLFKIGRKHAGFAAEVECWQLQVENRDALGLDQVEVDHLGGFIRNPETAGQRMEEDAF